ncbi:MAG: restriction endonuclease subunit S, partial [Candidatus Omnitrophica bacterium]|nr:restriction endonuclease subunit S [Candidatus Omnitrophota bacterium]
MQNVIPQGWIKCLLSEYAKIVGGGTPSTKNDQYWSGTIPWITSADIVDVNTIKPKRFITKDAISNSVTSLIPKNNVIFVSRVGLGKVAINRFPLCISQDSQGIIFDKNVFNLVYLANCLSMLAQKFVHQNQGTAIKGILKDDLATLEILCPPLLEQKLIAEIISTWDRAIETLGNLIDAKSNRFSWLLKTLTMPPSGRHGWKKILLGDIGEIIKGKGIMRKDIVEKGIPCIRYADLYTKYDFVVREIDSFVAAKAASSAQ